MRTLPALCCLFLFLLVDLVSLSRASSADKAYIYLPLVTRPALDKVVIQGDRSFLDDNQLYVVGEVFNSTNAPIFFAQVIARFYNGEDQVVAMREQYTLLARIGPNRRIPFKLALLNPPFDITRYELELNYQDASIQDYQDVTITSIQIRDNSGVEVFGNLRNDQADTLYGIAVAVTFYDASGAVFDADFGTTSPPSNLAPGQVAAYEVSTFEQFTPGRLLVQAEGYPNAN